MMGGPSRTHSQCEFRKHRWTRPTQHEATWVGSRGDLGLEEPQPERPCSPRVVKVFGAHSPRMETLRARGCSPWDGQKLCRSRPMEGACLSSGLPKPKL